MILYLCFSEGSNTDVSPEEESSGIDPNGTSNVQESDVLDNSNASTPRSHQTGTVNLEGDVDEDEDVTERIDDQVENIVSSESEAPASERAASGFSETPPIGSPRVQFENIKEEGSTPTNPEEPTDDERKGRRHRDHK